MDEALRAPRDSPSPTIHPSVRPSAMSPMRTVFIAVAVMAAAALVSAQRVGQTIRGTETRKPLPVRLGPDGRPLLFAPKINMCQNSKWNTNAVR